MKKMLERKTVIVTGGNKGLGRAMAVAAAVEGARVIIGARDKKIGEETVKEIKDTTGTDALFVPSDLTVVDECKKLIDTAVKEVGPVFGLINYAGILPSASLEETDEDLFNSVFDLNVRAAFFCTKFVLPSMYNLGRGSIINIGSPHAYGGQFDRAAYACSKGSLLTLTKHVANNYAPKQIRCNQIVIGWMITPGELALRKAQGLGEEWLEEQGQAHVPMGRLQRNEDFVAGSNYLLSDGSSQVTGTVLNITGGMNAW
jgi:NAD(P)-dependent dehydrogenase (short-subunit alcohol dehydrogenase family)